MIEMLAAQNWGLYVLRGVLAIILGVLAFVVPGPTLAALILVFAIYAIVDGILAIGVGLGAGGGPRWWIVLGGIVALIVGIYTLFNPQITATALVVLIGIFAIALGVAAIVTAISLRKMIEGEWLYILTGIVSVIFGAYVIVFPGDGVLSILWLIGIYAIFGGVMFVAIGLRLREVAKSASGQIGRASASS